MEGVTVTASKSQMTANRSEFSAQSSFCTQVHHWITKRQIQQTLSLSQRTQRDWRCQSHLQFSSQVSLMTFFKACVYQMFFIFISYLRENRDYQGFLWTNLNKFQSCENQIPQKPCMLLFRFVLYKACGVWSCKNSIVFLLHEESSIASLDPYFVK